MDDPLERIHQLANHNPDALLVFPEGENEAILKLCKPILLDRSAEIIVIGDEIAILNKCKSLKINDTLFYGILNPVHFADFEKWVKEYQSLNNCNKDEALKNIRNPYVFAQWLIKKGLADVLIRLEDIFPPTTNSESE